MPFPMSIVLQILLTFMTATDLNEMALWFSATTEVSRHYMLRASSFWT